MRNNGHRNVSYKQIMLPKLYAHLLHEDSRTNKPTGAEEPDEAIPNSQFAGAKCKPYRSASNINVKIDPVIDGMKTRARIEEENE